jgi:hypothetical protein
MQEKLLNRTNEEGQSFPREERRKKKKKQTVPSFGDNGRIEREVRARIPLDKDLHRSDAVLDGATPEMPLQTTALSKDDRKSKREREKRSSGCLRQSSLLPL